MLDTQQLWERNAELSALASAMDAPGSGPGSLVVVEGPAGIGKTSLLTETRRLAAAAGRRVFSARGSEMEQDFSFGLVKQLFESILYHTDPVDRERLLSGAAHPAAIALGAEASPGMGAGDFAVLHGLFWLTENLSEQQPLAIIVDDLQWGDVGSLRFLLHLLPRLEELATSLVFSIRPREPYAQAHLLDQIVSYPGCLMLHPSMLSAGAARSVIEEEFTKAGQGSAASSEDAFFSACYEATNGNPLLLHELARTLVAEGVAPIMANIALVNEVGARAINRRVTLWMSRLSSTSAKLAQIVSVLGDGASLPQTIAVAGMPHDLAFQAVVELENVDILRRSQSETGQVLLHFVHPLVRAAVYEMIEYDQRDLAHEQAAKLLAEDAGADPGQVAAHLLRTPTTGDRQKVDILRRAAYDALARGSPDTAITYLNRCLAEPPPPEEIPEVFQELGRTSLLIDPAAAAQYLREGLGMASTLRQHIDMSTLLGSALLFLRRSEEALAAWTQALANVSEEEVDLRRQLQANILAIPLIEPGRPDLRRGILLQVPKLRELPSLPSPGSRALDCAIAAQDAIVGNPRGVNRALRGVDDGLLVRTANGSIHLALAWLTLLAADNPALMTSVNDAVAQAYEQGSTHALTGALTYRAAAWLFRGNLAEAAADAREAAHALDERPNELRRLILGPIHALTLMEQGRLSEAQATLDWIGLLPQSGGPQYYMLHAEARLLRLQGQTEKAKEVIMTAGRVFTAAGGHNPALLPWQSEAALILWQLGEQDQARALAEEEVRIARRWTAPRALGHALRVLAHTMPASERLPVLEEAVARLERSPARLEYAEALADLGRTMLRLSKRRQAQKYLTSALDIAEICEAAPLLERIRNSMQAAGVSVRRNALTGVKALTPSELTIANLAASGHPNRVIAQELFVTVKAVEGHLSSIYRKLGITRREQLPTELTHDGGGDQPESRDE